MSSLGNTIGNAIAGGLESQPQGEHKSIFDEIGAGIGSIVHGIEHIGSEIIGGIEHVVGDVVGGVESVFVGGSQNVSGLYPSGAGALDQSAGVAAEQGAQATAAASMDKISPEDAARVSKEFLAKHVAHFTLQADGTSVKSDPTPELVGAISQYAATPIGQTVLGYANAHGVVQKFTYDPTQDGAATTDKVTGEITYNPAVLSAYANGTADASYFPGDQHQTATFTITIGHEFGHTPLGRAALNFRFIPSSPPPGPATGPNGEIIVYMGVTPSQRTEETRTVYFFENPVRQALGLPARTSYFKENDVLRWGPVK